MTRLSVCSLGVSCNEMIDTPMLLVVEIYSDMVSSKKMYLQEEECLVQEDVFPIISET